MKISAEDLRWANNQSKPRLRCRSTTFRPETEKQEQRQQRRLSEKHEIDVAMSQEEIDNELDQKDEEDSYHSVYGEN